MKQTTKKIIQALTYLANKEKDKIMDNMKAYKLLWLADRLHLRQTGRTITGDCYYAMPHGIVPSDAKCILEGAKTKLANPKGYSSKYIKMMDNHKYQAIAEADLKMFSDSDQEALDRVYSLYGNLDGKKLSTMSHKYPEWTFYRGLLDDKEQKNSYKVDLEHFFEEGPKCKLFNENRELLELAQLMYQEYNRC
jgi:uncharacterized phage-associated protein